jgi:sigma-E factor negative regulatory protein RseB
MRPGEGLVRQGGTTSYTRGMLIAEEPVLVTIVGEVPVNTARMVADSIAWEH